MLNIAVASGAVIPGREETPAPTVGIRPCTAEDIPAVADLFRRTFTRRKRPGAEGLEARLKVELFEHPWRDEDLASLVYVGADGNVTGFICIQPLRLLHNGTPVLAAVAGTLMVSEPARNPLAGARLLRSYLGGPQALSLSESANELSQTMWDKLGGATAGPYSMEWLRVLKPAGLAVTLAAERLPAARILRPLAVACDGLASLFRTPFRVEPQEDRGAEIGEAEAIGLILRFVESYPLRPAWDRDSLGWFLARSANKDRYGPLVRRVVHNDRGEPIGVYLYCVRKNAVAFVLQILAARNAAAAVVDDLIADAHRRGAVAVRGRVQPELADLLLRRRAVFVHAASLVVRSKRGELLGAVRAGEALITGLAGESWSLLIGGPFI
jgi:hypothetical protein